MSVAVPVAAPAAGLPVRTTGSPPKPAAPTQWRDRHFFVGAEENPVAADGVCSSLQSDLGLAALQGAASTWNEQGLGSADEPLDAAPDEVETAAAGWRLKRSKAGELMQWVPCMHAIVQRDQRALQTLYLGTAQRVYGSVLRVVRQAALAEEVVMDTYFQVWRQAARYDAARGHVLAWLLAIARSRAVDALRRQARFQHPSLEDEEATDEQAVADDRLHTTVGHATLHRALLALQAQPRQLVALAYFRGLSHEEIAQQTQLPLGTVKSQLRRALFALQHTLRPPPGTPLV